MHHLMMLLDAVQPLILAVCLALIAVGRPMPNPKRETFDASGALHSAGSGVT